MASLINRHHIAGTGRQKLLIVKGMNRLGLVKVSESAS
jgi:hypothetical protein